MSAPVDDAYAAVTGRSPVARPDIRGRPGRLASQLAVEDVAVACVATALLAAADLEHLRTARRPEVAIERAHVAAAVRSERYFRIGGNPAGAGFALLSRFWPTADGWLRTHANFPWHRQALLDVLGCVDDPDTVAAAIAARPGADLEDALFAAGGVAARVRPAAEWRAGPAGRAVSAEPLVGHRVLGPAPGRRREADGRLPAGGLRVLDLTRVIAGPVCTRLLGALGADVVRLDRPDRPDVEPGRPADTLLGKRSAFADLADPAGARVLHELLAAADVVVTGYRPGALDRFGTSDGELAERYPGLVVVRLAAWGHSGPWRGRRGFDSVVQAATGIAAAEAGPHGEPGALPCQLLDHGTGYLAAAAALDGVRRQAEQGGTHVRTLSLARTAHWLLSVTRRSRTGDRRHAGGVDGRRRRRQRGGPARNARRRAAALAGARPVATAGRRRPGRRDRRRAQPAATRPPPAPTWSINVSVSAKVLAMTAMRLSVVPDRVLHRHPDAAVQLDRLLADVLRGEVDPDLGGPHHPAPVVDVVVIECQAGDERHRARLLERDVHVGGAVLQRLEHARWAGRTAPGP